MSEIDARREGYQQTKVQLSGWTLYIRNRLGSDKVKTEEKGISYWYLLGEIWLSPGILRSEFYNLFSNEYYRKELSLKDSRLPPEFSKDTLDAYMRPLINAEVVEVRGQGKHRKYFLEKETVHEIEKLLDGFEEVAVENRIIRAEADGWREILSKRGKCGETG